MPGTGRAPPVCHLRKRAKAAMRGESNDIERSRHSSTHPDYTRLIQAEEGLCGLVLGRNNPHAERLLSFREGDLLRIEMLSNENQVSERCAGKRKACRSDYALRIYDVAKKSIEPSIAIRTLKSKRQRKSRNT
jgi:hypothetical protein